MAATVRHVAREMIFPDSDFIRREARAAVRAFYSPFQAVIDALMTFDAASPVQPELNSPAQDADSVSASIGAEALAFDRVQTFPEPVLRILDFTRYNLVEDLGGPFGGSGAGLNEDFLLLQGRANFPTEEQDVTFRMLGTKLLWDGKHEGGADPFQFTQLLGDSRNEFTPALSPRWAGRKAWVKPGKTPLGR